MPVFNSSPLLLNSAMEPVRGAVVVQATGPFTASDGSFITIAAAAGLIVDGVLMNAAQDGPLSVPATPDGIALMMWIKIEEVREGKTALVPILWQVAIPDTATVSIDTLVHLEQADIAGDYLIPKDVQILLDATYASAVGAAGSAQTASSSAVAALGSEAAAAGSAAAALASANTLVLPTTELVTQILEGMQGGTVTIDTTSFLKQPTQWAASTPYAVGDFFIRSSVIYYVVTAFTSGTIAPVPGDAAPAKIDSTFAVWASPADVSTAIVRRSSAGEIWVTSAFASALPTQENHLANKLYVDTQVAAGVQSDRPSVVIPVKWADPNWYCGGAIITARPAMAPGDILQFVGGLASNTPSFAASDDVRLGITGA